jgi:hypothetical protein
MWALHGVDIWPFASVSRNQNLVQSRRKRCQRYIEDSKRVPET